MVRLLAVALEAAQGDVRMVGATARAAELFRDDVVERELVGLVVLAEGEWAVAVQAAVDERGTSGLVLA
jgi:hypothetical protein